jgi:large subunit ribosomal protein L44
MRGAVLSRTVSAVWQRRLAKTPLRRATATPVRALSTTPALLKQRRLPPAEDPYTPTALAALLSRLSLSPSDKLQSSLLTCLTHPSFITEGEENLDIETNELLANLGNSLLGLFASEEIAARYPNMPSTALSSAVTSFVGPNSLVSVARELGISSTNDGAAKYHNQVQGLPIRWRRALAVKELADTPVSSNFHEAYNDRAARLDKERERKRNSWEEGVASVVRAFIGLIYQEQGLHAARDFVHAHFMSRHVDLTHLFKIRKPKHVLSNVVSKHLHDAGVPMSSSLGRIESRVLASSGTHTQSPLFNIGLFLQNGLKLAEGHGSSLAMAEHRAATNALLSLFLVQSEAGSTRLPTSAHAERPISSAEVAAPEGEQWEGSFVSSGASEAVQGLGKSIRPQRF